MERQETMHPLPPEISHFHVDKTARSEGADFPTWPLDHARPRPGKVLSVSRVYCGRVLPWLVEIGERKTAGREWRHRQRGSTLEKRKLTLNFQGENAFCLLLPPFSPGFALFHFARTLSLSSLLRGQGNRINPVFFWKLKKKTFYHKEMNLIPRKHVINAYMRILFISFFTSVSKVSHTSTSRKKTNCLNKIALTRVQVESRIN